MRLYRSKYIRIKVLANSDIYRDRSFLYSIVTTDPFIIPLYNHIMFERGTSKIQTSGICDGFLFLSLGNKNAVV